MFHNYYCIQCYLQYIWIAISLIKITYSGAQIDKTQNRKVSQTFIIQSFYFLLLWFQWNLRAFFFLFIESCILICLILKSNFNATSRYSVPGYCWATTPPSIDMNHKSSHENIFKQLLYTHSLTSVDFRYGLHYFCCFSKQRKNPSHN